MNKNLIAIPDELEPHLIGLWKFRQVSKSPTWCTTFMCEGNFHDTEPSRTPQSAINKAVKELKKAKKSYARNIF